MKRKLPLISLTILLLAVSAVAAVFTWLTGDLPSPGDLKGDLEGHLATPSVRIVDRHERLLYEILPEEGGRNTVVPLAEIPLALQQATVATEDSNFYTNPGVDVRGILRAVWINVRGGETLAGGSTITQQVARNLLLSAEERGERNLKRKLRESYLAWRIARTFSKDEILALYLNQIYYGGLAYGVEAAAQTFFGKPVAELDLAESALLAGLPQAPSAYNPFTDPKAAQKRQQVVLELMEKEGFIRAEQRELAARERLVFASTPYPMEAPHFVMYVRSQLDALFTPEQLAQSGGLTVRTTLDLDWQRLGEQAVRRQVEALRYSDDGFGHNVNSAALAALDPQTGAILSMVGSPDYFDAEHSGAINMTLAPRQPGSALKPLVYAAAFDRKRSERWTAATSILDVRTSFVTHDGYAYTPANYDNLEHGPVLARQALASSLNIPAVLALDHIGIPDLFQFASDLGISTLVDPSRFDLSVALGGGEVRLLELTQAYAAFANGGYRITPYGIQEVTGQNGETLYQAPAPERKRVMDERVAWLITDILSDNNARILGFGPNSVLRLDRPAAVKTGTTTNFHDNWTVGYTPNLVVGVWAGNTNYEPMRDITGLTGAAPIWHQYLRSVLSGQPVEAFRRPAGLTQVEVCALSGLLPSEECPYRRTEWFIDGTQPTRADTFYKTVTLDAATGLLAQADTPAERRQTRSVLDLPPQAQTWARSQGLLLYSDLHTAGGQPGMSGAALQIVSPPAGSAYRISNSIGVEAQRIHLLAVAEAGVREARLFLDGAPVQATNPAGLEAWIPLEVGPHQVWAEGVDTNGEAVRSETVAFVVQGP